jgi:acylphosphatase
MAAARFFVAGRVQGVAFRAHTRERARELGLRGYARNLADGRVEVLAIGGREAVQQLADWLEHGPAMARVDSVQREPADEPPDDQRGGAGFAIA